MHPEIAVILLLVPATVVVSLATFHRQYRRWLPFLWKQRLAGRVTDLQRRRNRLVRPADDLVGQTDRLRADLFRHHLRGIPVERLAEFPGIGTGTVARVREHA